MQAYQVVLGKSWQFDRTVIHNSFSNKYSFVHIGKNFNLAPLTPKHAYVDQLQFHQSFEKQRKSELRENERAKEREKQKEKK